MRIFNKILGTEEYKWVTAELPSCILCGTRIQCDPNVRNFFSKVLGLESNEVQYKILSEDEFHSLLAGGKCQWKSAYRAIVKPLDGPPIISGACYRHVGFGVRESYSLAAPRRQDSVILVKGTTHPKEEFLWFKQPEEDPNPVEEAQTGWPMHESCWMVAANCLRREFIENNIELFMRALNQEYRHKRADYEMNGFVHKEPGLWNSLQKDPMYIPELRQLTQIALEKHQFNLVAQIDQQPYRGVMTARAFRISPGSFSRLPLDVTMQIASYLTGPDLRRMMIASQWKFPSLYWKQKVPTVIFELYEVQDRIDWQYVGLEFWRLMERSNGIRHRLRIADFLSRIYASCHNNLGEVSENGLYITYIDI